jgi:hypothetical protein
MSAPICPPQTFWKELCSPLSQLNPPLIWPTPLLGSNHVIVDPVLYTESSAIYTHAGLKQGCVRVIKAPTKISDKKTTNKKMN